jgi:hypothetical protein
MEIQKSRNTEVSVSVRSVAEKRARTACLEALASLEKASSKCLLAGHMLNALKDETPHGEFMKVVERILPEITDQTANIWMRAAANVARALPAPPAIDVEGEVTPWDMLSMPDSELGEEGRKWKQQWFAFMEDKTIKECLEGVFVYGDEGHRVDRAINGKTKGGAGGDRKDFPLFVAVKLKDMGAHFKHWGGMSETQRMESLDVVRAAILGDEAMLRGRGRKEPFKFAGWPEEVCQVAMETLKERLKTAKARDLDLR